MRLRFIYESQFKFIGAAVALLVTTVHIAEAAGFYSEFEPLPPVAALTALGREMFFDTSLSASKKVSCANCHDPRYAYGPPPTLQVLLDRAVPSLRYLNNVPAFTEHFHDVDGDESVDQGPVGGYTWDGRAQSTHDQARLPLLSSSEMGNRDEGQVAAKLRDGPHSARFRDVFGGAVFDHPQRAFKALLLVLEVFQQNPTDFYPYTSKYDAFLRGQATLSPQQERGLNLFNDVDKGNCVSCHPSSILHGGLPRFTDFGFAALGIPRNKDLPNNADVGRFDMGLCGPSRMDLVQRTEYCGLFRVPSLRNVAVRHNFFHNGAIRELNSAVRFYAQRDSQPELWYPADQKSGVRKFDDLPVRYHDNVNRDPPFGRKLGDAPALSETEIEDIVVFLSTLTDGDVAQ